MRRVGTGTILTVACIVCASAAEGQSPGAVRPPRWNFSLAVGTQIHGLSPQVEQGLRAADFGQTWIHSCTVNTDVCYSRISSEEYPQTKAQVPLVIGVGYSVKPRMQLRLSGMMSGGRTTGYGGNDVYIIVTHRLRTAAMVVAVSTAKGTLRVGAGPALTQAMVKGFQYDNMPPSSVARVWKGGLLLDAALRGRLGRGRFLEVAGRVHFAGSVPAGPVETGTASSNTLQTFPRRNLSLTSATLTVGLGLGR